MNLISCKHCGAVFDLYILRADHSKDRRGNQTWIIDGVEWWTCDVCHSRESIDNEIWHRTGELDKFRCPLGGVGCRQYGCEYFSLDKDSESFGHPGVDLWRCKKEKR